MLQRLSEDLEYHELLDKAAKCHSSLEQMCYVAAFSVSSYSTTVHRTGKPFNPLLGETFELDRRRESGYRSLCEQVRGWKRGWRAFNALFKQHDFSSIRRWQPDSWSPTPHPCLLTSAHTLRSCISCVTDRTSFWFKTLLWRPSRAVGHVWWRVVVWATQQLWK